MTEHQTIGDLMIRSIKTNFVGGLIVIFVMGVVTAKISMDLGLLK